jgi:membrane protein insertase Oxa1/YidC/SpoIIIJ
MLYWLASTIFMIIQQRYLLQKEVFTSK